MTKNKPKSMRKPQETTTLHDAGKRLQFNTISSHREPALAEKLKHSGPLGDPAVLTVVLTPRSRAASRPNVPGHHQEESAIVQHF